jgi:hypothetical protein
MQAERELLTEKTISRLTSILMARSNIACAPVFTTIQKATYANGARALSGRDVESAPTSIFLARSNSDCAPLFIITAEGTTALVSGGQ